MALHLNLYHEIEKAKALKRRDPLKLSIYGLSAIAACFAGYYALQVLTMHNVNDDLARVKREFDTLAPQAKEAKKKQEELSSQFRASELLVKHIEGRFYWAPILEQIMQVVPRQVQITRMGGDITGEGLRRCSLNIDGLSAGADPRKVAEDLRTALAEKFGLKYKNVSSTFKTLEDGTELVMLDGKQAPTASFAINVLLFTGEEKTAVAAARKKK